LYILIISLFYIITLVLSKATVSTTLLDLITHINLNDFYLNSFYYVWTQFFILPSLILLLLIYHNFLRLKYKNLIGNITWLYVFFFTIWWILEYYLLNQYQYNTYNTPSFFNMLLQNPLNKYHPAIFFLSYLFILTSIYLPNTFLSLKQYFYVFYQKASFESSNIRKFSVYWVLISISLYMGAWWALQEGSWGGWWNWDPSEVFGLVILTKLLLIFHSQTTKQNFLLNILIYYSIASIIITIYLILQMSYTLVSHNFGLSLIGYGYVNIFFTLSLVLNVYSFTYVNIKYINSYKYLLNLFKYFSPNKHNSHVKAYTMINYLVITLIIYLYTLSFNPILNNIFWTSVSIEILNKWFSWLNVKLVLMLVVILLTISYNSLSTTTNLFYIFTSLVHYSPILLYNSLKPTLTLLVHNVLIILFLGSILNYASLHTYWCYCNESGLTWYGLYAQTFNKVNYFFENITLVTQLTPTHFNKLHTPNTAFWFSSNIETQFFLLDLTDNLLRQTIYSHVFMYVFSVTIFDISTNSVELVSILVTCIMYTIFSRKIKIVF
jgi:cytochrome c biogenesis factor